MNVPVYRVAGVLQQVGRLLHGQAVHVSATRGGTSCSRAAHGSVTVKGATHVCVAIR